MFKGLKNILLSPTFYNTIRNNITSNIFRIAIKFFWYFYKNFHEKKIYILINELLNNSNYLLKDKFNFKGIIKKIINL